MANIFEKNKTYLGDCLELMPQMESGMFDMILCDLPYGTTQCKWDVVIPFDKLWNEYKRLIKPNGAIVLFGNEPFSSLLRTSNMKMYKYDWKWIKNRPTGHLNAKKMPMMANEDIIVFYKYPPTFNREMVKRTDEELKQLSYKSVTTESYSGYGKHISKSPNRNDNLFKAPNNNLFHKVVHGTDKKKLAHPTQKPVDLFEYLIKTYTNEGELILDNCAGSGTTGEACFNTGRNYIQIEKEQKYFDLILGREKSFNKKDYEAQTSLWNTANGI